MELFETRLNPTDEPMSAEALVAAADCDVLVPTVTDKLTAQVLGALPGRVKLIANFGVGVDHIDLAAAVRARDRRHQHARRAHRGHRRPHHGADAERAAPHGRGRPPRAVRRMGGLDPDLHDGTPGLGQAARHRRDGPHRHRGCAPRARFLDVDPLPQQEQGPPRGRGRARGDLVGRPRPDAGAYGLHLDQLPAYRRDPPPAVGKTPAGAAAPRLCRQHRARRDHRRSRARPVPRRGGAGRRRPRRLRARAGDRGGASAGSTTRCSPRISARRPGRDASRWASG